LVPGGLYMCLLAVEHPVITVHNL